MADVTAPGRRRDRADRADRAARMDRATADPVPADDQRGQLILVAGLALALSFVALVLILNSAVYTENLATRGDDAPTTDALAYREDVRQGVAGAIEYSNRHNNASGSEREARKTALKTALNRSIDEWNELAVQHAALGGRAATVSEPTGYVWGTQLGQNGERAFTDTDGSSAWSPATGVSEMDRFRMSVNRSVLAGSRLDSFELRFRNSVGDTWSLHVYNSGGTTWVHIDDFTGSEDRCGDTDGNHTEIDLVRGTVDGKDCSALDFADASPSSYDIEIANGDDAAGIYELVVGPVASTGNAPYATPAIRAATVKLDYESPSLHYESTLSVEPHDPGAIRATGTGGSDVPDGDGSTDTPPSVTIDEAASEHTEENGNKHDFDVEGSVTDDTTVASVEIKLYDPSGNLIGTKRQSFASSSVTIDVTFDDVKINNKDSGTYRVVVTAYDDAGQSGADEWTVSVS